MSKTTETFATGIGQIEFMAAAKPMTDKVTGKQEYTIKLRLSEDDAAVKHLRSVSPKKIDTQTNRALKGTGEVLVSFSSQYDPAVYSAENQKLDAEEIPYFDSRKDTGTAAITYKVIDYGDKKLVRLAGIKLMDLNLAPREEGEQTFDATLDMLKNIG